MGAWGEGSTCAMFMFVGVSYVTVTEVLLAPGRLPLPIAPGARAAKQLNGLNRASPSHLHTSRILPRPRPRPLFGSYCDDALPSGRALGRPEKLETIESFPEMRYGL